jgi:signal transduction histidine kinase
MKGSALARRFGGASTALPIGAHVVQFYEHEATVGECIDQFVTAGLAAGDAAVVIATPVQRQAFARSLARRRLDGEALRRQGRLTVLDAADTVARLVVDGRIDAGAFESIIGGGVRRAAAASQPRPVRAVGEMVALLHDAGQTDAALQLEAEWNLLLDRAPLSLLCAYPVHGFAAAARLQAFLAVCTAHDHLVPARRNALDAVDAKRLHAIGRVARLRRRRVDLRRVIESAAQLVRPHLAQRGQVLVVEVPPRLRLDGDPSWLRRLFVELLDNAAKFGTSGGMVGVHAEACADDAIITVSDDGIGIGAEMTERVFAPFCQHDRPLQQHAADTGLGLTIARRIAELHDGRIHARSAGLCRGSAFVVTLPLPPRAAH